MTGAARGALALRAVTKHYGDVRAMDDVSLDVRPGEFVTLLGPSGSGKTTTLRVIVGFIEPDAGAVILDERDVTAVPSYRRDMGMVFQNYALFPHMTAAQNVAFPLEMRRLPRRDIERQVKEALELVQLAGLGARYPRQLSGGQQQRVALARAIVFAPCLLLMDEPLGALDKKLRDALQLEIKRISRQLGATVIYVTHDQEEALVLSDRIAVYNHGRIEQIGTPEALYELPASLFVANFVGESNVFGGVLELSGAAGAVVRGPRPIRVSAEAVRRAGVASGRPVAVVVRPERVRIRRDTGDGALDGEPAGEVAAACPGRVREAIYVGAARKYVVELESGTTAVARVQAGQQIADLGAGARVELSWDVAHGVLVPGEVSWDAAERDRVGAPAPGESVSGRAAHGGA